MKEIPQVTITKEQVMFKMPAAVDVYVNNKDQNIFPVAFTMGMVSLIFPSPSIFSVFILFTCKRIG